MKASFNSAGSIIPLPSPSKMSKACLISMTSSLARVMVTQSSGLNFLGLGSSLGAGLIMIITVCSNNVGHEGHIFLRILFKSLMDNYLGPSNPRIRSFLSPSHKYGHRSFSTSDSPHYQSQESFHPTLHRKTPNPQKIKLDDYRKGAGFVGSKLAKGSAKNKWDLEAYRERPPARVDRQYPTRGESDDLGMLIRELKGKAARLELQNNELKKKQQSDLQMIRKQNQTIINLREVLSNQTHQQQKNIKRSHLKLYAQGINYEEELQLNLKKDPLDCTDCTQSSQSQGIHEIAFLKIKQERNELRQEYTALMIKYQETKHELDKLRNENKSYMESEGSWKHLKDLRSERMAVIDEIDRLLFTNV